jgi:hypothetical protein
MASGKGDLRGAAERIEKGIELYGSGNLEGALVEFEEALKLHPGNARAKSYHSWIRGLIAGKNAVDNKKDELDQDAVRAVSEALEDKSSPMITPPVADPPLPAQPKALESNPAMPTIARDIADDHAEEPTIERRDAAAMMRQMREANAPMGDADERDSPWDPVPLTPSTQHADGKARTPDPIAELQSASTKSGPQPPGQNIQKPTSSSTLLGMAPLEQQRLLRPGKGRVAEDRPESVTREFRSQTPTGPNLRPLDVPELTDEQIAGLLALDSPLIPEGRTTPQLELDRIDSLEPQTMELDTSRPNAAPMQPMSTRKNDTTPTPIDAIDFDNQSLTPTGIKPGALRPVAPSKPEDDPYADLNLLPLEVPQDLAPDEPEDGTNPTNPFIRGPKLAAYTSYGPGTEPKLDELPSPPTGLRSRPPTEPGMTQPRPPTGSQPRVPSGSQPRATTGSQPRISAPPSRVSGPLARAEAALAAGDVNAAVDIAEQALSQAGAGAAEMAAAHKPLLDQIYGAVLGSPERILMHGNATANLDPRQAFLLSRIDGAMTVEDVLDVCGMPRGEALRLLALLARRGALKLR